MSLTYSAGDRLRRAQVQHGNRFLRSRSFVVLTGAAITMMAAVVGGSVAGAMTASQYQASQLVLLMPPSASGGNPYLANGTMFRAVDVLTQTMHGAGADDSQAIAGLPAGTWKVWSNTQSSAPSVLVTTFGDSETVVRDRLTVAVNATRAALATLQQDAKVPSSSAIRLDSDRSPIATIEDLGARVKNTILVGATILVLGALGLVWLGRRPLKSRRRSSFG